MSGIGHTYLQQQLTEHKQKSFASPSKNAVEKKKEKKKKKEGNCKAFCITRKSNNKLYTSRILDHLQQFQLQLF